MAIGESYRQSCWTAELLETHIPFNSLAQCGDHSPEGIFPCIHFYYSNSSDHFIHYSYTFVSNLSRFKPDEREGGGGSVVQFLLK